MKNCLLSTIEWKWRFYSELTEIFIWEKINLTPNSILILFKNHSIFIFLPFLEGGNITNGRGAQAVGERLSNQPGSSPQSVSNRRQMDKDDGDSALFAL